MYYLFNYLPILFLFCPNTLLRHISGGLTLLIISVIMPLYVVIVNAVYVLKKELSLVKSYICMISIAFICFTVAAIGNKYMYGYFFGEIQDALEPMLYLFVYVPGMIYTIGVVVIYFIKKFIATKKNF